MAGGFTICRGLPMPIHVFIHVFTPVNQGSPSVRRNNFDSPCPSIKKDHSPSSDDLFFLLLLETMASRDATHHDGRRKKSASRDAARKKGSASRDLSQSSSGAQRSKRTRSPMWGFDVAKYGKNFKGAAVEFWRWLGCKILQDICLTIKTKVLII